MMCGNVAQCASLCDTWVQWLCYHNGTGVSGFCDCTVSHASKVYGISCRVDALAVAMHEDFGSRDLDLNERQMRIAVFVGAHTSIDVRMYGENYACARDAATIEAEDAKGGANQDGDGQDM